MSSSSGAREAIISRIFERQERVLEVETSTPSIDKEIRERIEITKELILMTLQKCRARSEFLAGRIMPLLRDDDSSLTSLTPKEKSIFLYALEELESEDEIFKSDNVHSGSGCEYALKVS